MVFRDSEGKELRKGCQVRFQGDGNIYTIADFRNGLAPGGKAEIKFEEEHPAFVSQPSEHNVILVRTAEEMRAEFEAQDADRRAKKALAEVEEALEDDEEDDEYEVPGERKPVPPEAKRRPRGRPKGSKNKVG